MLLSAISGFFLAIGLFVFGGLVGFQPELIPALTEYAPIILGVGLGGGFVILLMSIFALVSGILGIKGFKEHDKKLYVENIVFSVLGGGSLLILAGAILGLIALAKEKKAAASEPAEVVAE